MPRRLYFFSANEKQERLKACFATRFFHTFLVTYASFLDKADSGCQRSAVRFFIFFYRLDDVYTVDSHSVNVAVFNGRI